MIVMLDTGVLGDLCKPRRDAALDTWMTGAMQRGRRLIVPEICDYELRRELLRNNAVKALALLDALGEELEYLALTTTAIRHAAGLWAELRNAGAPTAADAALDGDCILAAQALGMAGATTRAVVVATSNVGHLSRMVDARAWAQIS